MSRKLDEVFSEGRTKQVDSLALCQANLSLETQRTGCYEKEARILSSRPSKHVVLPFQLMPQMSAFVRRKNSIRELFKKDSAFSVIATTGFYEP